jgi:hypothetical protein
MILKSLSQHSNDRGFQQLHVLIKELKYYDIMDIEYLLNYLEENNATLKLLSNKKIIKNIMRNNKK